MQLKKMYCMVVACMLLLGTMPISARAAETATPSAESVTIGIVSPLATNSFNMSIPAKTKAQANMNFPLMAGETVTIKASYAPFDASVDFGLVDSDGVFHYFNITTGSIDKTIKISTSGNYTFQIRNNSDGEVKVSGFVNY